MLYYVELSIIGNFFIIIDGKISAGKNMHKTVLTIVK